MELLNLLLPKFSEGQFTLVVNPASLLLWYHSLLVIVPEFASVSILRLFLFPLKSGNPFQLQHRHVYNPQTESVRQNPWCLAFLIATLHQKDAQLPLGLWKGSEGSQPESHHSVLGLPLVRNEMTQEAGGENGSQAKGWPSHWQRVIHCLHRAKRDGS